MTQPDDASRRRAMPPRTQAKPPDESASSKPLPGQLRLPEADVDDGYDDDGYDDDDAVDGDADIDVDDSTTNDVDDTDDDVDDTDDDVDDTTNDVDTNDDVDTDDDDDGGSDDAPESMGDFVDATAAWRVTSPAIAPLRLVSLRASETLFVLFTTRVLPVVVHYVEFGVAGYLRCNAPDCLLCRIGRDQQHFDLLPVYDLHARQVAILPVSPSMRPSALRPQLQPPLLRVSSGDLLGVAIRRPSRYEFVVTATELSTKLAIDMHAIEAFADAIKRRTIDLAAVYPRMTNTALAQIPEVRESMLFKGLAE